MTRKPPPGGAANMATQIRPLPSKGKWRSVMRRGGKKTRKFAGLPLETPRETGRMMSYSHGQRRSATAPWITNPRRARISSKPLRRSNRLRGRQGRATGLKPISERACNRSLVETGLTPTWKLANGQKAAKARLAAEGQQVPDLEHGLVETSGDVSLRPPQLHAISLSAITNWRLRSPVTEDASLKADGLGRGVFARAPGE